MLPAGDVAAGGRLDRPTQNFQNFSTFQYDKLENFSTFQYDKKQPLRKPKPKTTKIYTGKFLQSLYDNDRLQITATSIDKQ